MQRIETTLYWAFAGALMGPGVLAWGGIPRAGLLIGIFFMSYGLARLERRGIWAALFTFGAVPAVLLLRNYLTADPSTFFPEDYLSLAAIFGAIALAGLIWGLVEVLRGGTTPRDQPG